VLQAPAPSRPALWPVVVAYLVAFVAALGASAVFVVVAALPRAGGDAMRLADEVAKFAVTAPGLMGAALVDAVVLALVAGIAARLQGKGVAARLRLGPTRASPLGLLAAVVGMAGLSLAGGAAAQLVPFGHGGVMDTMAVALQHPGPTRFALGLFTIGLAPGIAEETFFRGLLQTRLAARWGRWPAIVLSALGFGLFHVDPVQGSLAFVAGLLLGWMVERFGGIRPSIAAHAINNAMFVALASVAPGVADVPDGRAGTAGVLVAGAVVCAASIAVLRSRFAVRASTPAS
jgi:membrane protease YdiL (CAAX protease family)